MMFNDAIDQVKASQQQDVTVVKLGEVTSLSSGRPRVKFYGDASPSTKDFACIDGYFPSVGDKVAMLPQANTYIIIGKIINAAPVEKYTTKEEFNAAKDKLIDSSDDTVTLSGNALIPKTNNQDDIGSSSYKFKKIFADALVGAKLQYQSGSTNNIAWSSSTDILPNNNNTVNLGSSSKQLNKLYTKELYINGTNMSSITVDKLHTVYSGSNRDLTLSANNNGMYLVPNVNDWLVVGSSNYKLKEIYFDYWNNGSRTVRFNANNNIVPSVTNSVSLGTSSYQYKDIYGQTIYSNGSPVSSDKRKKKNIKPLDSKYDEFFKALRPVSFEYKDVPGKHTGFIAQEVEDAAMEAGLRGNDVGVVLEPESNRYYLAYTEIIAVQTKVIQELMSKVDSLEARLNKLEAERSKT